MKKILTAALIISMAVLMMVGCKKADSNDSSAASQGGQESSQANSEATGTKKLEKGQKLIIGTNAEFPPFEYVKANGVIGEFDGVDMAIAKEIGERLGMEVEISNMDFNALIPALDSDRIDCALAGMTITGERLREADFSDPYYTAIQAIVVPASDETTQKVEDLAGKKVGVVTGYTGALTMKDAKFDVTLEHYTKGVDGAADLRNGRIDALIIDKPVAETFLGDDNDLKIITDQKYFEDEKFGIAVKKGETEVVKQLNEVLKAMTEDGTIDKIILKYVGVVSGE